MQLPTSIFGPRHPCRVYRGPVGVQSLETAALADRRTKNLRAVQFLFSHSKLKSSVRYLGAEVDDALEIAEQTEI